MSNRMLFGVPVSKYALNNNSFKEIVRASFNCFIVFLDFHFCVFMFCSWEFYVHIVDEKSVLFCFVLATLV